MKLTHRSGIYTSIILACIVALCFWLGWDEGILGVVRIIFGLLFLLFLPGWWLTIVFFDQKEIDEIERGALSFALSISIIPLLVFYLNLIGLPITEWLVWGVVVSTVSICIAWLAYKYE